MAEVFDGTPAIVNVTISDQESKQVSYHVAGRDLSTVAEAVRAALTAIPDEEASAKPKKARKKRRTKAELAAAADLASGSEQTPEPSRRKTPKEPAGWPG